MKFEPKKPGGDWVRENFYQMPAVAVKTLLLKLKSDIKATEGEVIANLQNDIKTVAINAPVKLDKFGAKIIGPTYVMQGCLLYTSPSPRDRTRSRMPSSA
mgnify:CR=1 FL=1